LGNYIGIDEPPKEIFGKIMSIPDSLIYTYFELVTDVAPGTLAEVKSKLASEEYNPRDLKMELGVKLVSMYYSREQALQAQEEFERMFSGGGLPNEIPEVSLSTLGERIWVVKLLTATGMANSGGEARRLIKGGGLYLDNDRITDDELEIDLKEGMLFKIGKRRFFRIVK
jgi:tyrosyl-tRNA synthetase